MKRACSLSSMVYLSVKKYSSLKYIVLQNRVNSAASADAACPIEPEQYHWALPEFFPITFGPRRQPANDMNRGHNVRDTVKST